MAKALIAAVSLALVLVAAVVVPLVVMPGVFGFDDWPEAVPQGPREHVVTLDLPARHAVRAEREPRRAAPPRPVTPPAGPPLERLAQAPPSPPPAVRTPEEDPQRAPAPAEPQAAPEAQPAPTVLDAREGSGRVPHVAAAPIELDPDLDGTNLP